MNIVNNINNKKTQKLKRYNPLEFIFYGLRFPFSVTNFISIVLWTLCNVTNDVWLADMFSAFTYGDADLKLKGFRYLLLVIVWAIIEWIGDTLNTICAEDIEVSTRKYYFQRMYRCKPSILREHNTGYISGLVDKLTYRRADIYQRLLQEVPLATVYLASICILMAVNYHWAYALVIFLTSFFAIIFRIILMLMNKKNIDELNDAEAENVQLFLDAGTNVNTAQKLQAAPFLLQKFSDGISRCRIAVVKWVMVDETGFCGFKLIANLTLPICLVIYLAHPDTIIDKAGFFSFLAMIQLRLLHMVRTFSVIIREWAKYKSPFDKLEKILNDTNVREPLSTMDFSYAEIRNCDYSYEYTNPEDKETVKTVRIQIPEFRIYKGDIVCIHGESGQGKTTLLNILSGEIETDTVYINGKNTKNRLDCVFIAQDTEIFDMSILDNLRLGNDDVSEDEIMEMFEATGLDEWFKKQPQGLNTRLGERGVFVSTGQRQRLNLIRGLLIPYGEIYLLDEPTSNVDSQTEEKMINLIQEKLKGKTAVIVTHKPGIMKICNKRYIFENGIIKKEL